MRWIGALFLLLHPRVVAPFHEWRFPINASCCALAACDIQEACRVCELTGWPKRCKLCARDCRGNSCWHSERECGRAVAVLNQRNGVLSCGSGSDARSRCGIRELGIGRWQPALSCPLLSLQHASLRVDYVDDSDYLPHVWVPDACDLRLYNRSAALELLARRPLAIIGDSTAVSMYDEIVKGVLSDYAFSEAGSHHFIRIGFAV